MSNFQIEFTNPWLLLLLIPALFFALFPYFRLSKRFRRTRNRVISVVLHSLIMVLAVTLLAGIGFSYQLPNMDNEILLLVDVSHSSQETQEAKDEFILSTIEQKSSSMKLGIVTFGYDQVYAAPLSYDGDGLYDEYLNAELPDTSATDFEAALRYAGGLFEHPESAKIVVISDGDETDGNALSVSAINALAAEGIKVDTVLFPNENAADEVRISGVTYPESGVRAGEQFTMQLELQSNYRGLAYFTMYDNGTELSEERVELDVGTQSVSLDYTFSEPGLHEVSFRITSELDTLADNNLYHSYYYLEVYDDILVIERESGESAQFVSFLTQSEYNPTVVDIQSDALPSTVDELRNYDEVVLFNIAFTDMPEGFEEILYTYVHDIGGSLFTVGGNRIEIDEDTQTSQTVANAYNRESLKGSEYYGDMLPVELVDYTPPIAVAIIIDISGSMSVSIDTARQGAIQCLNALSSRDYVGVLTLSDSYATPFPINSMTDMGAIIQAIYDIPESGGGTNYASAFQQAGAQLYALRNSVQKKHIIVISDAQPGDAPYADGGETPGYLDVMIDNYLNRNITCSFVSIGNSGGDDATEIKNAFTEYEGMGSFHPVSTNEINNLHRLLSEDLSAPEIREYDAEPFTPRIYDVTGVVSGITQATIPQLGGYYGTRLKDGAVQPLVTQYGDAPVYAQWDYGAGKVGSFLSDLYGTEGSFSYEFLSDEVGQQILNNILMSLYPSHNIRSQEITLNVSEKNYTTDIAIATSLNDGEWVRISVTGPTLDSGSAAEIQIVQPSQDNYYSSASFTARAPGLYTILVEKLDAQGNVLNSVTAYRTFSYSAEYNVFADEAACEDFMANLAYDGRGAVITESMDVFENLVRVLDREYDPRILFIILIIVMFLLDVAVRKFKFKWPHEIIRDHKEKKRLAQGNTARLQRSGT